MNDEASPRANAKVYDEASVFEPDNVLREALRLRLTPSVLGSACWAQNRPARGDGIAVWRYGAIRQSRRRGKYLSISSPDRIGSSMAVGTEPLPKAGSQLMAIIRIGAGVLWLTNTNWKTPPDFGQSGGGGLYGYTKDAVDHSVFAPFSWIVQHGVLPNFRAFGWMVLVLEAALAAFLILGLTTRFWALVGAVQAAVIGLSVGLSPGEWPWSYYLMVMVNISLWATAAGRTWGLDGVVRPVLAMRPGKVASTLRRAT